MLTYALIDARGSFQSSWSVLIWNLSHYIYYVPFQEPQEKAKVEIFSTICLFNIHTILGCPGACCGFLWHRLCSHPKVRELMTWLFVWYGPPQKNQKHQGGCPLLHLFCLGILCLSFKELHSSLSVGSPVFLVRKKCQQENHWWTKLRML